MISIFKKNDVINYFLLLPYIVLIRVHSVLYPVEYQVKVGDSFFAKWIFNFIENQAMMQSLTAIVLIYIQAALINILCINNRLHALPSALSGMIYALFASVHPDMLSLSPCLIGVTFLVLATFSVFEVYKKVEASAHIFNAAISLALAGIMYYPFVIATVPVLIGLGMLRNFNFRERMQFIFAILSIIWITWTFLFVFTEMNFSIKGVFGFVNHFSNSSETLIIFGVVLVILILCISNYYNLLKKKVIESRKKIDYLFLLAFISIGSYFIFQGLGADHFIFLAYPLAILFSMVVLLSRNVAVLEMVHFFVLIAIFFTHFGDFLQLI